MLDISQCGATIQLTALRPEKKGTRVCADTLASSDGGSLGLDRVILIGIRIASSAADAINM